MAKRVLAVDDDESIVRLIQESLERAGYEVEVARDGIEALEAVARQKPDLIVLDYSMPRLNGRAVWRRLKRNPATYGIPVIMLHSSDDDLGPEGEVRGVDCQMGKPLIRHHGGPSVDSDLARRA